MVAEHRAGLGPTAHRDRRVRGCPGLTLCAAPTRARGDPAVDCGLSGTNSCETLSDIGRAINDAPKINLYGSERCPGRKISRRRGAIFFRRQQPPAPRLPSTAAWA